MTVDVEPTKAPLLGEPLPVELMNTIWADRSGVHDALGTDAEVLAWLRAVGPRLEVDGRGVKEWLRADRPSGLGEAAVDVRRLRDAMRRLAAEETHDPRPAAASATSDRATAVEVLNQVAATSLWWPALVWPVDAEPVRTLHLGRPVGAALASLLAADFVDLLVSDARPRLRACLAPGCVLYFAKDHNRREWCSSGCGNRARAARHYRRRKATRPEPTRR
jgi:predicted RNA-binding Zn ribbon-like protein